MELLKSILVIPDPHDQPEIAKDRFRWLGNLIIDRQPDAIVHLGDGLSMDSLSEYDEGTIASEGRRYKDDIESFLEAQSLILEPTEKYNRTQTRKKKILYKPRKVYCMGNHEQRISKAVFKNPKLEGVISFKDLELEQNGWEVFPMTDPADVYGIAFSHFFTSGIMGRPISGVHHAASLVQKNYCSTVVGHSHDRSFWENTDCFGIKIFGLVAGCYFDHDLSYTREEDRNWVGLVWLSVYSDHVDPDFISIKRTEEDYG